MVRTAGAPSRGASRAGATGSPAGRGDVGGDVREELPLVGVEVARGAVAVQAGGAPHGSVGAQDDAGLVGGLEEQLLRLESAVAELDDRLASKRGGCRTPCIDGTTSAS